MTRPIAMFLASVMLCLLSGCSSDLTRSQSKRQIDAMLKPHPVGSKNVMSTGFVPGFELPPDDTVAPASFELVEHKEYGNLSFEPGLSLDEVGDGHLLDALRTLGYITAKEEGPKSVVTEGTTLSYSHSHTVRLTQKVGTIVKTAYSADYDTGFSCYPEPNPDQCNLPPLLDIDKDNYKITGIVQDSAHAKVNILIPWRLTKFGLELKAYARPGVDTYLSTHDLKDVRDPWEEFLNSHSASGSAPATILFQKFDDGWRIVDENGKSEKDFD